MLEWMGDIVEFGAKAVIIVMAIGVIFWMSRNMFGRPPDALGQLTVRRLNESVRDLEDVVRLAVLNDSEIKALRRARKAEAKAPPAEKPRVFVLDFDGDIWATAVDDMRYAIDAVLGVANAGDEVVVRLESGGGVVHSYGFASSQLERVRRKGIRLVVCVDRVAASGGYLMACVADRIVAAPFAIVGSIGVVAEIPNIHRLLQKAGVDYEEVTAGQYKRTLTVAGEITDEKRRKLEEQLLDTHDLFKGVIKSHRPSVDIEAVATGEHWYGSRAVELRLVDECMTSDEYLRSRFADATVLEVKFRRFSSLRERFAAASLRLLGLRR